MRNVSELRFKKMNYVSLQYLCLIIAAIGAIVAILGGLGANHYSLKAQKEKEAMAEAEKKAAVQGKANDERNKLQLNDFEAEGNAGNGIYINGDIDVDAKHIKVKRNGGDGMIFTKPPNPSLKSSKHPK
jgi:hypothetical protein